RPARPAPPRPPTSQASPPSKPPDPPVGGRGGAAPLPVLYNGAVVVRQGSLRPLVRLTGVGLCVAVMWAVATPDTPALAQIRISNLSVFLNDLDVTVHVVLLGAIPPSLHESLHSGVATHLRYTVELWQYSRLWIERRLSARTVERQLTYNVLTKEYK